MSGGGFAPLLISAPAIAAQINTVTTEALLAIVAQTSKGLVAKAGEIEIPLPRDANIPVGTRVRISITNVNNQPTVRITPAAPSQSQPQAQASAQPSPTTARNQAQASQAPSSTSANPVASSDNAASAASSGARAVARQIQSLPALIRAAATVSASEGAARPQQAPAIENAAPNPAVRHAAAVLFAAPPIAADVTLLMTNVQAAAAANILPQSVVDAFAGLFTRVVSGSGEEWMQLLRASAEAAGRTAEGRIARAAIMNRPFNWNPGQHEGDVRTLLLSLLSNAGFKQLIAQRGVEQETIAAASRMADRVVSTQVLNAHTVDQPYFFMEIPFRDDDGFSRAQIHITGNGSGNEIDAEDASIVMDLSLTHLGDLWIALHVRGDYCLCTVRAASDAAREAFDAATDELEAALARAGFSGARVNVQSWDGDRVRAFESAWGGGSGMDVSA